MISKLNKIPTITPEMVEELKMRLGNSILPPDELQTNSVEDLLSYGVSVESLKNISDYWINNYDFTAFNQHLESLPHFTASTNQLDQLHFLHYPPRDESIKSTPLLLVHGWPGSFLEFTLDLIPLLQNQDPSLEIIVPSLPGFAFSSPPKSTNFGVYEIAKTLNYLMVNLLGFGSGYIAQGGDWGSIICKALGTRHGQYCKLIHLNLVLALPSRINPLHYIQSLSFFHPNLISSLGLLSRQESTFLKRTLDFVVFEAGYQIIQGTRPQTLAYSLSDSPMGLLAWLFEKFSTWSGVKDQRNTLSKPQILNHVTLYYMTNSIGSSLRIYREHIFTGEVFKLALEYCPTPTACSIFPGDLFSAPKSWTAHRFNLIDWKVHDGGGHFAAMEKPKELCQDILCALKKYKQGGQDFSSVFGSTLEKGLKIGVVGLGAVYAIKCML